MMPTFHQPPPIVPGYDITVDAGAFVAMIHTALRDLASSGRRCDLRALAEYMSMLAVLRGCVTIDAMQTCTVFSPNAVAE